MRRSEHLLRPRKTVQKRYSADTEPVQTETDSSQKDQNPHDNEENNKNNNVVNMDTEEDSWEAQLVPGVSEVTSPEEMRAEKFLSSTE